MDLRPFHVADLRLDQENPRMPDLKSDDQDTAILELVEVADLGELVNSISNSGWINFEPLIALPDGTVIEGNRRLAALKIIRDERLQELTGISPPYNVPSNAKPETLLVNVVPTKDSAREFIGFKHINGAFKWDSYAKARFAHDWYRKTNDIALISRKLGDSHSTVSRLVNAYAVLRRAEDLGFDRKRIEKKNLYFSHLYTALPAPNVRSYLGIEAPVSEVLTHESVPQEYTKQLLTFMTWLYGQGSRSASVRTQNPDLGKLVSILGNTRATSALEQDGHLSAAFEIVENKSELFAKAVMKLRSASLEVMKSLSSYDGDADVRENVSELYDNVEIIKNQVDRRAKKASDAARREFLESND